MITLLTVLFLMLYSMSVMSRGKFSALALSVRSGFGGALEGGTSILPGSAHPTHSGILPEGMVPPYGEAMKNLRRYVRRHHLDGKVTVVSNERGVVISLVSDDMLFERGQAELRPKSDAVLERVAQILKTVPNQVAIEGHTCNLPIHTGRFPSNWELSTARAGTVLRYFTERAGLPNGRFMAAGYADTRPLVPNSSEANRAHNRRVDIVILKTDAEREADGQPKTAATHILLGDPPRSTSAGASQDNRTTQTGVSGQAPLNRSKEQGTPPLSRSNAERNGFRP